MATDSTANLKQAVPFFMVSDIEASVLFYVDGLGFHMTKKWVPEGKLSWCWLERGATALMLQEFSREGHDSMAPEGKVGVGVNICFICEDALAIFHELRSRGIEASRPFVGNAMWVTSVSDPDGYRLDFEKHHGRAGGHRVFRRLGPPRRASETREWPQIVTDFRDLLWFRTPKNLC